MNPHVRLVDEDSKDITAPGATGELLIRGPTIISGYLNNPAANAAAFDVEGYFRTGDIVSCGESDGAAAATAKWYMVDRKKELIKVRGFQVSPAELEDVLLQNPAVIDAAVIGVRLDSSRDGEIPRAYVVRQKSINGDTSVTEQEVKGWCAQRLAKYKGLSGGVVFVDAVPRKRRRKVVEETFKRASCR